jgi:hypothetical protein
VYGEGVADLLEAIIRGRVNLDGDSSHEIGDGLCKAEPIAEVMKGHADVGEDFATATNEEEAAEKI